jgi:hypothetical protein
VGYRRANRCTRGAGRAKQRLRASLAPWLAGGNRPADRAASGRVNWIGADHVKRGGQLRWHAVFVPASDTGEQPGMALRAIRRVCRLRATLARCQVSWRYRDCGMERHIRPTPPRRVDTIRVGVGAVTAMTTSLRVSQALAPARTVARMPPSQTLAAVFELVRASPSAADAAVDQLFAGRLERCIRVAPRSAKRSVGVPRRCDGAKTLEPTHLRTRTETTVPRSSVVSAAKADASEANGHVPPAQTNCYKTHWPW